MVKEKVISSALAILLIVLCWSVADARPQSSAINLAPHRAIYDMSLKSATAGSNVSDVRGRLVFDFQGSSCNGYTLTSRLVTEVVDREGNSVLTDLRSTTWENSNGDRFRFKNSQYIGRHLSEEVSGQAARRSEAKGIQVNIKEPAKQELSFSGPAMFPTQHSVAILEAARAGNSVIQADVYDGAEQGNKLFQTTTFIGRRISPDKLNGSTIKKAEKLKDVPAWPVAISYFEKVKNPASDQGLPVYELSFQLFANGVSRDLIINYGTFLVSGELTRLDFYDSSDCKPAAN